MEKVKIRLIYMYMYWTVQSVSVQVSVYQKFVLSIEAKFTDETIVALYILPFKFTKNLKLSLLQFKNNS